MLICIWVPSTLVLFHFSGDYAILIKSGLHWITALGFNVLSSLSAIVGLLVGVAISDHSDAANEWILAGAAGFFLYISLTDLVSCTYFISLS